MISTSSDYQLWGKALIRLATASDAAIIAQIYAHYVEHSHATFEETPPSTADMAQRLEEANVAGLPFLVAQTDSSLAGYAS